MACSSILAYTTLVLAFLAIAPHCTESAVSCGSVATYLSPCVNYSGGIGPLTPQCCNGVRGLSAAARTTPDRQQTCNCLKTAAGEIQGLKLNLIAGIPSKCGINIPYAISPSTDCSRVK